MCVTYNCCNEFVFELTHTLPLAIEVSKNIEARHSFRSDYATCNTVMRSDIFGKHCQTILMFHLNIAVLQEKSMQWSKIKTQTNLAQYVMRMMQMLLTAIGLRTRSHSEGGHFCGYHHNFHIDLKCELHNVFIFIQSWFAKYCLLQHNEPVTLYLLILLCQQHKRTIKSEILWKEKVKISFYMW